MKKLLQFCSIALLGIFLAACSKPADPKAEFKLFSDFQGEVSQQLLGGLNHSISTGIIDEQSVQEFSAQTDAAIKKLQALPIRSDEIKALKDKYQVFLKQSSVLLTAAFNAQEQKTEEAEQALLKQQQKYMELTNESIQLRQSLAAKYSEETTQN